jgi:hypothetical protein
VIQDKSWSLNLATMAAQHSYFRSIFGAPSCLHISNQDSTECGTDGDLMCKWQDIRLEQRPKHSIQRDGIQDETRRLMQLYDDSRNVLADIGVLIPKSNTGNGCLRLYIRQQRTTTLSSSQGVCRAHQDRTSHRPLVILRSAKVGSFGVQTRYIQRHYRAAGQHRHVSVR